MTITPGRGRYGWLRRIAVLDPERDCQTIHRITAGYEFPWDYQRALEFALFRTYCVPSISALLAQTGEFERRPQKRYDDTALLMAELVEHGYDSERGRESLRTINRMHARYSISDDDMLYVLTTFVYEPIAWIDSYGWRRLHPHERLAAFHFYREVGKRMGIKNVPESYTALAQFQLDYEHTNFRFSEDNRRIGTYTLDLYCSWFPSALAPVVRRGVLAMLDEPMTRAFGFPAGSPAIGRAIVSALRIRARAERVMPKRRRSRGAADASNKTYPGYPDGYRPSDLGAARCPYTPDPPRDTDRPSTGRSAGRGAPRIG